MHKWLKSRRNSWTSCTYMRCRTVVQRHREARGSLEKDFHFAVVVSSAVLWHSVPWLICKVRLPWAPKQYRKMNLQNRSLGCQGKGESLFCSRHRVCGVLVLQSHHLFWPSEILLRGGASHQLRGLLLEFGAELGAPDNLLCTLWHQARSEIIDWIHGQPGLWSHGITHRPLFSPKGTKASVGP